MSNEKVSQMTPLTAAELAVDDVLLITDTSQKQSKKIAVNDLLIYFESTGTFNTIHANFADSASSVLGSGVSGIVSSASYAINSRTSSFALNVAGSTGALVTGSLVPITASFVNTASFTKSSSFAINAYTASSVIMAQSASYLIFTPGVFNGTASYALSSSQASTASFTVSSSHANNADTASISISASYATTASYINSASFGSGIFSYGSAISNKPQTGLGTSISFPNDILNFSASLFVHSPNSKFLINMTVQVGSGTGPVGVTGVSLWRSSSVSDTSLQRCINGMVINESSALDNLASVSTTYIDIPNLTPGTNVIYRGRAFNSFGNLLINTSGGGNFLGTSSLTVVEFV